MTGPRSLFRELRDILVDHFRGDGAELLDDQAFNELALRIFRLQCLHVGPYGAFVARRGVQPHRVTRWEDIPFLPTSAFKVASLLLGSPGDAQRVFRTSGTTRGRSGRGAHHVRDLSLYREALRPTFRAFLVPEGGHLPVLSLLASPGQAPVSSLSFMMGEILEDVGRGEGGFFVDSAGEVATHAFREALSRAQSGGRPVLVAGTAFGLVHWMETARARGWRYELPGGSRIMETGGYKGRSRALSRGEFYRELTWAFGVPQERIVNEYGMTELLSQFYEPVMLGSPDRTREGRFLGEDGATGGVESPVRVAPEVSDPERRYHRGPPWTRTLVLDPLTLAPLTWGQTGILAHLDLANLGSVSAVLTEDLGQLVADGFRLHGRNPGSEPRGCSLAMEDFLRGAS